MAEGHSTGTRGNGSGAGTRSGTRAKTTTGERKREQIMRDTLKQHYFEIIHRMSGEQAAPSHDEWIQERGEVLSLQ